jgi:hypothetical protein
MLMRVLRSAFVLLFAVAAQSEFGFVSNSDPAAPSLSGDCGTSDAAVDCSSNSAIERDDHSTLITSDMRFDEQAAIENRRSEMKMNVDESVILTDTSIDENSMDDENINGRRDTKVVDKAKVPRQRFTSRRGAP